MACGGHVVRDRWRGAVLAILVRDYIKDLLRTKRKVANGFERRCTILLLKRALRKKDWSKRRRRKTKIRDQQALDSTEGV
jgi:hypothetical protein